MKFVEDPEAARARAEVLIEKAVAIDPDNSDALRYLASIHADRGETGRTIGLLEKALALDPNHADSMASLAFNLSVAGRAGEGLVLVQRAMRVSPYYPRCPVST